MRSTAVLRSTLLLLVFTSFATSQMKVDGFHDPMTKTETGSLLALLSAMQPAASKEKNAWSYGMSGQTVRALGLIYQSVETRASSTR